jgi:hypothetical protein
MEDITKKVAARFQEKTAMAVILRNVVNHNWGWFSREDQRMHLQTVDEGSLKGPSEVKVWLENKGKRIFELSTGKLSGSDLKKLKAKVEADRAQIEIQWTIFMISNQWLRAEISGSLVTLTAYHQSHNRFIRLLELRKEFPGAYYDGAGSWDRNEVFVDLDPEHCALAVGTEKRMDDRNHFRLDKLLWEN